MVPESSSNDLGVIHDRLWRIVVVADRTTGDDASVVFEVGQRGVKEGTADVVVVDVET